MELSQPTAEIPKHHTTLRRDLWNAGFRRGVIVHQRQVLVSPDAPRHDGDSYRLEATALTGDEDVLDAPFHAGHGLEENPLVVAQDDRWLYLYDQYDGATSMFRIRSAALDYLGADERIPQPGG